MIKKNDGFALVLTMLFALLALTLTGALMFIVLQGSKISGSSKRYSSIMDAARGAVAIAKSFIVSGNTTPAFGTVQNVACTTAKISQTTYDPDNTYQWSTCDSYTDYNSNVCTVLNATSADPKVCPDFISDLGEYRVYTKLADAKYIITNHTYNLTTVSIYAENPTLLRESVQMIFLFSLIVD
ncbi:MAG: hypothetical protein HQL06_01675 [Nitrospirae bacterium]|nr:hypothetical protein [Nitrospirota bacterium]